MVTQTKPRPVLEIDRLTLSYPSGVKALDNLSLSVAPGEIFGLLGLNGAGKSSLIKGIVTLLRPTSGGVRVFGMDTRHQAKAIKALIGVMPQESNLDALLNVRQNLLFHAYYAGLSRSEAARRADIWLDKLDLQHKAKDEVMSLSGGNKRKLMLAKAFLTEPKLLVLDEPSPGLDPGIREQLWEEIRCFQKHGGTVFLSTHYLEEAEALCSRIGILHRGKLCWFESHPFSHGTVRRAFFAVTQETEGWYEL